MAGISSFINNPQYQRTIQRIMSMTPDQRAVLDTTLADRSFATSAIKGKVQGLREAADIENRDRGIGLRERELESELSQAPTLRNIGIGQVVSAGLFGLADIFNSQQRINNLRKQTTLINRISGNSSILGNPGPNDIAE